MLYFPIKPAFLFNEMQENKFSFLHFLQTSTTTFVVKGVQCSAIRRIIFVEGIYFSWPKYYLE